MKRPDPDQAYQSYLQYAYSLNYKEQPPTMEEFLCNPKYLGGVTGGGKAVYPVWKETLDVVSKEDSKYLVVLTGAIGCLGPDVRVSLLDGRELTIPEIMEERKEGKQHWVYSYDIEQKKMVPGKVVDALLSGQSVDNIVEVELDNGEKVRCTHNHPFLLTTGEYRNAEDLAAGDSLEPLYRELGSEGYELSGTSRGQWRPTFRTVAEALEGVPKGSCVHHKDFEKSNNDPSNLQVMTSKDHRSYHANIAGPFQIRPGFASECAKKACELRWNGPGNSKQRVEASDRLKKRNAENQQASKACAVRWNGPDADADRQHLSSLLKKRNIENHQNLKALEARWSVPNAGENHSKKMKEYWDKVRSGEIVRNHKVVAVHHVEEKMDVYDLSIEDHHNFALTSGVFVHNTGKTRCAIYGILYTMCRILCLKDPWAHFGLAAGGQMSIVFFNLTKSQSESNSYKLFQSHLMGSPWFKEHGMVGGSELNPKVEFPLFKYTFASPFVAGFGCFTADTLISSVDGRELTIPQMEEELSEGENLWVYSYDVEQEKMVPGRVSWAGKVKKRTSLVAVHLDNGEVVRCTPDHRFMLRDGTYRQAQFLTGGDSLMPLYRKYQEEKRPGRFTKTYELHHCGEGKWIRTHWVVGDYMYGRTTTKDEVYHHIDFNKKNNSPVNLIRMDRHEHFDYHSHLAKSRSPRVLQQMKEALAEYWASPEGREVAARASKRTKKMNRDPEHKKKVVAGMLKSKKYHDAHAIAARRMGLDRKLIQRRIESGAFRRAGLASWESMKLNPERYKKWNDACMRFSKERRVPFETRVCACGCGGDFVCKMTSTQRFIYTHHNRGENNPNSAKRHPGRKLSPWNKGKTKETDSILARTAEKISETKQQRNHKVAFVEFLDAKEDVYDITVERYHNFALSSGVFVHNSQGENVIAALMDEVDSPVASEVQRKKVIQAYENARRRMDSRFVLHGDTIGRFFMVASKQERLSFLNAFIAKYKTDPAVMIVDIPLWRAKPTGTFSSKMFRVMLGDIYNPPKILESQEEMEVARRSGFSILEVPVDFYNVFVKDIVGALRDIAGVSVSHIRATKLFPSESLLVKCYTKDPNPSKQITIEIGLQDKVDLLEYIDLDALVVPFNVPRYIHVDYAYSGDGDACGIGMSCIRGWVKRNEEQEEGEFVVQRYPDMWTDFVLRIKGRPGDKIPLPKIRKLILDLKNRKHINVRKVSYDLSIATEDAQQILNRAGVETESLSMDRDPQMYRNFRCMVEEERWATPYNPYLHFELKHLEDDPDKNKIDHPDEVPEMEVMDDGSIKEVVFKGSKDVADGGVGSVCLALRECQCPPDQEVMESLLGKASGRNLASESPDVFRLVGIEVKREDKEPSNVVPKEGVQKYTEMLQRMRSRHNRGF